MSELSQYLRNVDELNETVSDKIREMLEEQLEVPDAIGLLDEEPHVSADISDDWIICEFEVTPNRQGQIIALSGAYTLQMYDGEDFLEPTTDVEDLNNQLANI